jgi:hypothetical protein
LKLTRARGAARRPSDDDEVAAGMKLGGGGARARRGEEDSGDWCGGGRARASAFYRGRREVDVVGEGEAVVVNGALHCHWE